MSECPAKADFIFSDMDWKQYTDHRPAYPAQLYGLIHEYHQSHGGGFETALDVGAGVGIVTREFLLKNFAHATMSDPSDAYVSQAKSILAPLADSKRLSFLTRKIEETVPGDLPNGPVDIITAGICLHWADPLRVTPSAAQLLKSGGTFSAWAYAVQPVVPASFPDVERVWKNIFRRMFELFELKAGKLPENGPSVNINSRFDNMPFDPKDWKNVRRIKVMPERAMFETPLPMAEKRVLPDLESEEVLDDEDFISRDVNCKWMEEYLQTTIPPVDVQVDMASEFKELRQVMGDRVITMRWPVAVVLATKR